MGARQMAPAMPRRFHLTPRELSQKHNHRFLINLRWMHQMEAGISIGQVHDVTKGNGSHRGVRG